MTHQDIANEMDALAIAHENAFKALTESYLRKSKDVQAECGRIGHIWTKTGAFVKSEFGLCTVCHAQRPVGDALWSRVVSPGSSSALTPHPQATGVA